MSAPPRFSQRAVRYLEDFDTSPADEPLSLQLQPMVWHGEGDNAIRYDGPNLQIYVRRGRFGTDTIADAVTVPVGSRTFVMRLRDLASVDGRYVELLPVFGSSGGFSYVLAIV